MTVHNPSHKVLIGIDGDTTIKQNFQAKTPKKSNKNNDNPGIKRALNLSTIQRGQTEIWDGTNPDDLRKLALDFIGTNLSKDLIHFKPIKIEKFHEVRKKLKDDQNLGLLTHFHIGPRILLIFHYAEI